MGASPCCCKNATEGAERISIVSPCKATERRIILPSDSPSAAGSHGCHAHTTKLGQEKVIGGTSKEAKLEHSKPTSKCALHHGVDGPGKEHHHECLRKHIVDLEHEEKGGQGPGPGHNGKEPENPWRHHVHKEHHEHVHKELAIHPTDAIMWCFLGFSGGGTVDEQYYTKKDCYIKALELEPRDGSAWFYLGQEGGGNIGLEHIDAKQCLKNAKQMFKEAEAAKNDDFVKTGHYITKSD